MLRKYFIRFAVINAILILFVFKANLFAQGNWEDSPANPQTWTTGNVGIGTSNPVRLLHLNDSTSFAVGTQITNQTTGSTNADGLFLGLFSNESVGFINYENTDMLFRTNALTRMTIQNTGNIGIGTTRPQRKLDIRTSGGSGVEGIRLKHGSEGSVWGLGIMGISNSNPGAFTVERFDSDSRYRTKFLVDNTDEGNIGIGTTTPQAKLDVNGGIRMGNGSVPANFWGGNNKLTLPGAGYLGDQGSFGVTLSWNTYRRFDNQFPIVGHGGRYESSFIRQGSGGVEIATATYNGLSTPPTRLVVKPNGRVGIGTTNPQSTLHVNGTTRTKVLTITGGADLAEPFEMSDESLISAGDIVVIDPENPGQLKRSGQAYDSRVAGIVSGAGGVNPGLTLQQEGLLDNGQNVALTGRVYAKVSTCNGPVKPGDLLTTSAVAGHAMKATDRESSHGTIIGKAMTSLEDGEGLVLVLVNLQ